MPSLLALFAILPPLLKGFLFIALARVALHLTRPDDDDFISLFLHEFLPRTAVIAEDTTRDMNTCVIQRARTTTSSALALSLLLDFE